MLQRIAVSPVWLHRQLVAHEQACVAVYCSVLQRVAACCSVLQCHLYGFVENNLLHEQACVAACCSVLQRVAACCSVLQRVALTPVWHRRQPVAACELKRLAVCRLLPDTLGISYSIMNESWMNESWHTHEGVISNICFSCY